MGFADLRVLLLTALLWVGIAGFVLSESRAFSFMFAAVLFLDGAVRFALAMVSRYPGWRINLSRSLVELTLAAMLALNWPLSGDRATAGAVAVLIGIAGWNLIRFAYSLRTHQQEVALLLLPGFVMRDWYDHAPVLADYNAKVEVPAGAMTLYVWMPALVSGSAWNVPVVNRYLMARDHIGNLSVGHVAIGLSSGFYVSHYRDLEASPLPGSLLAMIGPRPENRSQGLFRQSYADEQDLWGPAHCFIQFNNYSLRRLQAFWVGYRQDATYNVVNRNCSTLVAGALDACLEGALASPHPWRQFIRLLMTPDFWQAAFIRNRAESLTWTPGLIRDYAEPLARIVDRYSAPPTA